MPLFEMLVHIQVDYTYLMINYLRDLIKHLYIPYCLFLLAKFTALIDTNNFIQGLVMKQFDGKTLSADIEKYLEDQICSLIYLLKRNGNDPWFFFQRNYIEFFKEEENMAQYLYVNSKEKVKQNQLKTFLTRIAIRIIQKHGIKIRKATHVKADFDIVYNFEMLKRNKIQSFAITFDSDIAILGVPTIRKIKLNERSHKYTTDNYPYQIGECQMLNIVDCVPEQVAKLNQSSALLVQICQDFNKRSILHCIIYERIVNIDPRMLVKQTHKCATWADLQNIFVNYYLKNNKDSLKEQEKQVERLESKFRKGEKNLYKNYLLAPFCNQFQGSERTFLNKGMAAKYATKNNKTFDGLLEEMLTAKLFGDLMKKYKKINQKALATHQCNNKENQEMIENQNKFVKSIIEKSHPLGMEMSTPQKIVWKYYNQKSRNILRNQPFERKQMHLLKDFPRIKEFKKKKVEEKFPEEKPERVPIKSVKRNPEKIQEQWKKEEYSPEETSEETPEQIPFGFFKIEHKKEDKKPAKKKKTWRKTKQIEHQDFPPL